MKVGITFSTFDLLHIGHIKMLEEAKQQCDYLIVGLQIDPSIDRPNKNKPIQTIIERYTQLKSCIYVDEIIPYIYEKDIIDIIQSYSIDVRIIGEEYKYKMYTGKNECKNLGIKLYYNKRQHRFSSTYLRKHIYYTEKNKK
jgi:glycerol-3-phosphate cytidylyltransferase